DPAAAAVHPDGGGHRHRDLRPAAADSRRSGGGAAGAGGDARGHRQPAPQPRAGRSLVHPSRRLFLGAAARRHGAVDLPERPRLGATAPLAVVALLRAALVGVTLGVVAAIRQGGLVDTVAMLFAQLGVSMPVYWLALLLMLAFAVMLNWLPAIGRGAPMVPAL